MTMTEHEKLLENLAYLKMKEMGLHLDETIDFINKNNLSFTEGLVKLTNYEIDHKEASMIKAMVKVGAFPHQKELKDFDFTFQENINKEEILEFTSHRFIHQNENIVFIGSSGVGKTHLSTSIGISAAKKRISTYFIKCHDLIAQLKKANMTTNINFSSWDNIFMDPVIANAILDRVLHHAHVVQITGKSYRLKDYYKEEDSVHN